MITKNQDRLIQSIKGLESLIAKYDDIADASMKNDLNQEGFYTTKQVMEHLSSLQEENRNLKIGIIGRVKAGKSSLINSLLFDGKEVLPKAATPMTAALTSIGFAEEFTAEVRFFNAEDIGQLKTKSEEYQQQVESLIKQYKNELEQRKKQHPQRPLPPVNEQQLRVKAMRAISENGALSAAADLYERIKSTDVDYYNLGESTQLVAESAEALNVQLREYVGSDGRYMPFTRELILGMPLDTLKGIEVLDTPGVNDPVKSREQRTYERLKECNAAFIVSPTGQFLSEQDFELADRLSSRDGTQEIFIVASQADTQLHSNLRKDAQGVFPEVLIRLNSIMQQQAQKALSQCENDVLKRISTELSTRLFLTSGICETLIVGNGDSADSTASHTLKLLKQNYPDYFSQQDALMTNLNILSGRKPVEEAIESVRRKKEEILEGQANTFIEAQLRAFNEVKESVLTKLAERRDEVENSDKAQIEEKLSQLSKASSKGVSAANMEFKSQVEEMRFRLPAELERVIQKALDMVDEKTESAEGSEQHTRRVKSSGFWGSVSRFFGAGGYENESYSVSTLQPLQVRRSLEGFSRLLRNGLKDCATQNMLRWRADLISGLSRQLRESMGDESVDITRLQAVCSSIVNKLVEFPEISIPELPAELAKSTKITGSAVNEYIEAAHSYATVLEKAGYGFVNKMRRQISSMENTDVGKELLNDLTEEMQKMQQMIENKALTLEKMSRMSAELRDL